MNKAINLPENITVQFLEMKVSSEKEAAVNYQKRRWKNWDDNYALYRDRPQMNFLTQRQEVNVPLMKETIKTVLSKIDEEPEVTLKDRGGDADKEIIMQEKWNVAAENNRLDLQDIVEKKQVLIYGRVHIEHNWKNEAWKCKVLDAYDLVVDPKTSPLDIQTANHLHRLNLYKHLREVIVDEDYDQTQRDILKAYLVEDAIASTPIASSADITARNERLRSVGATDSQIEDIGSEQMIELNLHFTKIWDKSQNKFVKYVVTSATTGMINTGFGNQTVLRAQPIKDEVGLIDDECNDLFPYDTWADDLEATDYWSDSIADTVRTPNKLINSWLSQLTENRTLANYNMNFYDSTAADNWVPTGYDPRPFGWYPLPGKPNEVYQAVKVENLDGVINEIQYVVGLVEKATATGAVDKGVVEQGKRTLGEVEIAVNKAMERTTSMAKYYRRATKDKVQKWIFLEQQNSTKEETLDKTNPITGQVVSKTITKEDWYSEKGYKIVVESFNQQLTEKTEQIQRLGAAKQFFSEDNIALNRAIQKRALSIAELNPDEKEEIINFEKEKLQAMQPSPESMVPTAEGAPVEPGTEDMAAQASQLLGIG